MGYQKIELIGPRACPLFGQYNKNLLHVPQFQQFPEQKDELGKAALQLKHTRPSLPEIFSYKP
jgi:hypothetical protein